MIRKKLGHSFLAVALMAVTLGVFSAPASAAGHSVFINEFHYDNTGGDVGEAIEIAGPAGTDLSSYSIVLYNGNNGGEYNTIALTDVLADQGQGYGTTVVNLPANGLQNGSPDGIALVNGGTVVEFLSYEGTFAATNGPANGLTSIDIGVSEPGTTPIGQSLQRTGTGTLADDFTWVGPLAHSFGETNVGQSFEGGGPSDPVINEFVANHTGADTEAFIEVLGTPSTDLSAFTLLEIEGDSPNQGTIDAVIPVGTTDAGGYWIDDEDMENGTVTILLVEDFTGSAGTDLDTDDDGVFDVTPWSRIVDDVATTDGGGSDIMYSSTQLAAFFDGNPFGPGGASRIPNGADTDTAADWVRNDFDGFGFPGFAGSQAIGEAVNTPGAQNEVVTILTDPVGVCADPATLIHDIQGSGSASADTGNIREIEGVVVGVFLGGGTLGGINVQEEDADADADAATSEGIFVFDPGATPPAIGDVVRVRGTVTEFNGLTEINQVETILDCGTTGTATAASLTLPVSSLDDYEAVEGMAIDFGQTLFVSGNFTQARFGEVDLSVGGPLDNPTNVVEPGAAANALQAANNLARIQLDDGLTGQNVSPPPYFDAGTLRTGDSVTNLAGVMSFSFGNYEVIPTGTVDFVATNPRPDVPDVGGSIQVAAYNVLNYFTTIDGNGAICGPNGDQGCRGADSVFEFDRQRAKLVTAISKLDAEVVGLMEIENDSNDVAVADLVSGLNDATAPGTYDYIATGAIGDDAIRVALLYKPADVTPVGDFDILDTSDDPRFLDDFNRPMLTQTFVENASGAVFTVSVNHLKSKGSNCDGLGDPDAGDGQGNCNGTRTAAAEAIVDHLATDPTGSGDPDFLIVGDLNAYAKEDPIDAIKAGGYTDLVESFVGTGVADGAYSFNFFSQSGYLDHGLATADLVGQVSGVDFWHVNTDEPSGLDYNSFNQASLYAPDEFRSSDHDPIVIGLDLDTAADLKNETIGDLGALLPTGDGQDDFFIEKAITRLEQSLTADWWVDESTVSNGQVFDREFQAVQELEKVSTIDVQAAIDQIVLADYQLAWVALTSAEAAGGNSTVIDRGWANMADAAANLANGEYAKAVNDYKKAWQNAEKA